MSATLADIFNSHREILAQELTSFSLPRDSRQVENTVTSFLNNLFENDGDYRQSLTQSEDYILQAAIQLLKAQQNIAAEIVSMASEFNASPKAISTPSTSPYITVLGAGIGSVAGGFLGTWGALCGAIAGTAISVYLAARSTKIESTDRSEPTPVRAININAFINIVKKICESIDNLMETYRVQVKRVQASSNQKQDTNLLNSHASLLDKIADVITEVNNTPDTPAGVAGAVKMMAKSLENYGLKYDNERITNDK